MKFDLFRSKRVARIRVGVTVSVRLTHALTLTLTLVTRESVNPEPISHTHHVAMFCVSILAFGQMSWDKESRVRISMIKAEILPKTPLSGGRIFK